MKKLSRYLIFILLVAILSVFAVACSSNDDVKYSEIKSIDVDENLRKDDFIGYPVEKFEISQIILVITMKDTTDENGLTVPGEVIRKNAEDYMLIAEDREKLRTPGTKSITLRCYGFEITFPLKLYSEITEKYTVSFYEEDGETMLGTVQRVPEGGRAEQPVVPGKSGYTFYGWIDMDTNKTATFDNIRKNTRLKAYYVANTYSVKYYYLNGGETVVIAEKAIPSGESGDSYYPETPILEGYDFVEWIQVSNTEYRAIYSSTKYPIKFVYRKYDGNKYDDALSTITIDVTDTTTEINPPIDYIPADGKGNELQSKANDYKFLYWYIKKGEDKIPVSFPITLSNIHETTYYAYYIKIDEGSPELVYKKSSDSCIISGYNAASGTVVIPEQVFIDGVLHDVTGISAGVFKSSSIREFVVSSENKYFKVVDGALYSVDLSVFYAYPTGSSKKTFTLANETEEIDSYAFYNAFYVEQINLNNNLLHIRDFAFRNCIALKSLNIPENVIDIGEGALKMDGETSLRAVTFTGTELVALGDEVFYGAKRLQTLSLPASLSSIGDGVFYGCMDLEFVDASKNSYFNNYNGALYNAGYEKMYVYPAKYKGNANPEVALHVNCKKVLRGAFYFANISCITIYSQVELETYSIVCPALRRLRIEYSEFNVTGGFIQAFADYIPSEIYAKDGVDFSGITEAKIVYYTQWQSYDDYDQGLAYTVKYDNANNPIGIVINAYNANEKDVEIPSVINGIPIVEIADDVFNSNIYIETVSIPIEVVTIGRRAFMNCINLKRIAFDEEAATEISIGDRAFYGCTVLSEIIMNERIRIVDLGEYVFDETEFLANGEDFVVIGGVLVSYKGSKLTVDVPASVKYIATDAFKDCSFITSLSFAATSALETVDSYAFLNCSGIKQLVFPSTIRKVKDNAFYGCDYLYHVKYLAMKESVDIGEDAYYEAGKYFGGNVHTEFADTVTGSISYRVGAEQTIEYGIAFVEPFSPGLTSSELFIGWYYDSNYKTRASFPLSVDEGQTVNLYAYIEKNSYISDGLVYSKNDDGTYSVSGYVGSDQHVIMASQYMGSNVTGIGKNVFGETVVEISIPNTLNPSTTLYVSNIISLGLDAFINSKWYKDYAGDFVIYDNLLIGYKGNSKVVIIPETVSILADGVFKNNQNIETVILPKDVSTLPQETFSGCTALKKVVLTGTVTSIEEKVFYGCTALEDINFDEAKSLFVIAANALDNTLWLKNQPKDCIIINGILYKYLGKEKTLHIPSGVISIAADAFKGNSNLVTLYLPSTLTTIRQSAFENIISLNSVYITSGNTKLGYILSNAFKNCYNLSLMQLSNATSLAEIGDSAFENCMAYKTLQLSSSLTILGKNAFKNSGVTVVTFAEGSRLDKIEDGAFDGCRALQSVTFAGAGSLNTVGIASFRNCTMLDTFSAIKTSLSYIEDYAFYNCRSLTKININENLIANIGKDAVYQLGYISAQNTNMITFGNILVSYTGVEKEVEIPARITIIYNSAFEGNTNITTIKFGKGSLLKKINDRAFYGCANLAEIEFPNDLDTVGYQILEGTLWYSEKLDNSEYIIINNILIRYNISYTRQADIPEKVTKIIKGAFANKSVYDIKIGDNVKEIEEGAFDDIIPAIWSENGQSMNGWTLTITGEEPALLGYLEELPGCLAIYMSSSETMDKFSLNDSWQYQADLLKLMSVYTISYNIIDGEAEKLRDETVHALYNAKEVNTINTTSKQYVFVGWFRDAAFTEVVTYPLILSSNMTIYAKCIDYDRGSNPEKYALDIIEGTDTYTITNYYDTTDKNIVIITKQAKKQIKSITGYLGYIECSPDDGNDVEKYVYNEDEGVFELYDIYGSYPDGTIKYKKNTVIEEIGFANNCTIETLGANCFAGMTNLVKVTIPASVKYIAADAFADCINLKEVIFSEDIDGLTIATGAFRNCESLQSIVIPAGITELEDRAFAGCVNLKEIYLEAQTPIVLYQGAMPFEIVANMKIYIPYGRKAIYSSSWADYYYYLLEMPKETSSPEGLLDE